MKAIKPVKSVKQAMYHLERIQQFGDPLWFSMCLWIWSLVISHVGLYSVPHAGQSIISTRTSFVRLVASVEPTTSSRRFMLN